MKKRSESQRASGAIGIALVAGMAAAAIGPHFTSAQDRAAGEPFVYSPPPGFVVSNEEAGRALPGAQQVWVMPLPSSLVAATEPTYRANVSLVHTPKTTHVDASELASLARGMPQMFASTGITWTEVRHFAHTRPDGSRVGVIEGASTKGDLHYRSLQLAFPDDSGTSIVTASFPDHATANDPRDAAEWNAAFEQTIDSAKGVAFRAPPPPGWIYLAWGGAAALITLLAFGVRTAKKPLAEATP